MKIGDNIKKYRMKNKISQAELSDMIGKSKSSIEKYEANKVGMTARVLEEIALALNVSISDLINQDDYDLYPCEGDSDSLTNDSYDCEVCEAKEVKNDIQPNHYNAGKYDVIWFCHYHNLSFDIGNIIKYVFRAGKKDKDKEIQDLEKAKEYINRRIIFLKEK